MKTSILLAVFFAAGGLPGQIPLWDGPGSVTRAVVIGISDYQDDKIPDLQFAHRDAQAFEQWLRSPAGGEVPEENIQLLINEEATMGKVAMALWALMGESKEGDKVVFYFSGHGDVETKTISQPGYWMCWDAPAFAYMSGGCFNVRDLQEIVSTLSLQNKAHVLIVSDACHAGKLAGSEIGGPQATTSNLSRQFANEVKILSCQPDEFSLEGTQWGGGRGCFSFHLTDGLYGLADRNNDQRVTLLELENYLEEIVPAETAPHPQLPFAVGNKSTKLAKVDPAFVQEIRIERKGEEPTLEPIKPRGMEDWILAQADTNIVALYEAFNDALERKNLITPKDSSANDYYLALIREPSMQALQGLMTRNFAAALIDESQQVTNKLLKTDPQIVDDVLSRPFVFDHIPGYLGRAIELLGENHFLYTHLKAKQCYFEAKTYRQDKFPDWPRDSLSKLYVGKLEEGLKYDSAAAYIYLEMAFFYGWLGTYSNQNLAQKSCDKAIELSPNCAFAYFLKGSILTGVLGEHEAAIQILEKALSLDSTFFPTFIFLGLAHSHFSGYAKFKYYLNCYVESIQDIIREDPDKVPIFYLNQMGNALWKLGRVSEAEKALLNAETLSKGQVHNTFLNLVCVYSITEDWERLIEVSKKFVELSPLSPESYWYLGAGYYRTNQYSKAIETYLEGIRSCSTYGIGWEMIVTWRLLADVYLTQGRKAEADSTFEIVLDLSSKLKDPRNLQNEGRAQFALHGEEAMELTISSYFDFYPDQLETLENNAAILYSLAGKEIKACEWLERLEEHESYLPWAGLLVDLDLFPVRSAPCGQAILKKYFPEGIR